MQMRSSTDCDVCFARRWAFSYNEFGMAMVYLLIVISRRIECPPSFPVGRQLDVTHCTRSLTRRLHHRNLPVMHMYEALCEHGFLCPSCRKSVVCTITTNE